jgi:hypothetical protein
MEFVEIGSIKEGDRIKWQFPPVGDADRPIEEGKVQTLRGWGHSKTYDAPYVEFVDQATGTFRAVGLPFITHVNGRRADRSYWSGRLPELVRQSNGKERVGYISQLTIPLNEEDALATALKTSTRKSLDEMSDSHRLHIEKWEPHVDKLGAEHVWASANRFSGRGGDGPVYVALKRGSKDYAIVDYDTSKKQKAKVLEDGFESSTTLMEAFKAWRAKAKEERGDDKASKKPAGKTKAPAKGSKSAPKKGTTKKTPVRKGVPKKK